MSGKLAPPLALGMKVPLETKLLVIIVDLYERNTKMYWVG
jgi:hypothetical protein